MPSQNPLLENVIEAAIEQRLDSVFTSLPGIILNYDRKRRTATVQVLIADQQTTETGGTLFVSMPPIPTVPVVLPGDYSFGLSLPILQGGPCLVVFSMKSIANWKNSGGGAFIVSNPQHQTLFHPGDCFCIPGCYPPGSGTPALGNEDAMTMGNLFPVDNGVVVAVTPTEVRLGHKDASDPVCLKSDLDALKTWIHTVMIVNATGAIAGTTTPPPSTTGATKVKGI